MAAILDLLGRQRKQRVGSAADVLASAARDHAAGKTVDVEAVDRALHELSMPLEHFVELCRIAVVRHEAGAALEKLGLAQTKQRRLSALMEAERLKHDELRKACLSRMAALEADEKAAAELVAKGQQARETLLMPSNVLGSVRQRYEEALAEKQEALVSAEKLRREQRDLRNRLREADRWIESITRSVDNEIRPPVLVKQSPQLPPAVARQLEPHELDKRRIQRRTEELEPQLREAEERLDRAERAVVAVELEILTR